jgi:hypothetical protein
MKIQEIQFFKHWFLILETEENIFKKMFKCAFGDLEKSQNDKLEL